MVAAAAVEPRVDEYRVMIPQPGEERLFEIRDAIREELSCALRVSASVMQDEIDMARLLSGPLTATWRAWELGQITRRHVAVMAEAVRRLAQIACDVNERTENIGARRLSTVMERLLDEVSFDAPNRSGQSVTLDVAEVDARLAELSRNEDLARYVL
jgi:ATP-dependent protease HslVU (ClpYQ) ATPase subunit